MATNQSKFDAHAYYDGEWVKHRAVAEATHARLLGVFAEMLDTWLICVRGGGKILFFGNGGSAADAQHLATELVVRYSRDRRAIPAMALTVDSSALTATGNDLGFDRIFARQIEAIGRPGDVAVGISTSGRSVNVIEGLKTAKALGLVTCGFTGGDGGGVKKVVDHVLLVPSHETARIQEMHIVLGQMLCGALERALGYVE
jgi:D-sedoheptulose 7-phosphate isomerase